MPAPAKLVHPFTDWVTVYIPAVLTGIDGFVDPLFHNNVPVQPEAVRVEVPSQFSTTDTVGTGVILGAAVPEPGKLVHPLTDCVTEYTPALLTVIEAVVSAVLHVNVPV